MAEAMEQQASAQVLAAMCVDTDAFDRLGLVLRQLVVGLVDQAVNLRLVGPEPRLNSIALGPIQTVIHQKISWPVIKRRTQQLIDVLSHRPPNVVHAMSVGTYPAAMAIADAFDADLVLQVTSKADLVAISPTVQDRARRIIASSQPLVDQLLSRPDIRPSQIELIRPGLLAGSRMTTFVHEGKSTTLVCTSNLQKAKRVDVLIRAVSRLRKKDLDILLFLLGQGSQDAALRKMVRKEKLSSAVTFANPRGNLTRALESADIFVRPSTGDAFTVGALQAMAAGVVVITCENTACDHYRDGETAVICKEQKAEAIAAAIEKVMTDRAFGRRIAEGGLEYVRQFHSVSGMAEKTAAVYRQLALRHATIPLGE
jgi:hypothetical protein